MELQFQFTALDDVACVDADDSERIEHGRFLVSGYLGELYVLGNILEPFPAFGKPLHKIYVAYFCDILNSGVNGYFYQC
jgi:hypothetical protein